MLAVIEGLRAAGVDFHLAKHENAAGFMAEGAWHADSGAGAMGPPAILVATIGPGVANAVNVVANAEQDRVPLLFLTGCLDPGEGETYTHQIFDHQQVLRPIVKASFRADAGAIGAVMDKAIAIACSGQPGPVHIDLPIGAMEGPAQGDDAAPIAPPPIASAPSAPADGPALEEARRLLAAAERPLAVLGVDAVNEGAGAAVRAFLEAEGIPSVASYKGKGLVDDGAALSLGGAGLSPKADAALQPVLETADLILLIGYDPIEMRKGWKRPWPDATPIVEIAPVRRDHGMHAPARVTFQTAIVPTLAALRSPGATKSRWTDGQIERTRSALAEAFAPEEDWGPARAFHVLRDVMPDETVVTVDSGAHRILVSQVWRCLTPRTMLQSTALCTMGCAVPLAIGHAMARPETPVVAFVGDAGLEMVLGELATARDMKVPVIVAVLVDESLALIELKQRGSQRPNIGVDFAGSDFPAIAAAMGGVGVWVDDETGLRAEAAAALTRETYTVLAVRIGRRAYDGKF